MKARAAPGLTEDEARRIAARKAAGASSTLNLFATVTKGSNTKGEYNIPKSGSAVQRSWLGQYFAAIRRASPFISA